MPESLASLFQDPAHAPCLLGTTPPKEDTSDARMADIGTRLLQRLKGLDCDGLIVYDLQDESSRVSRPRPFPFRGTRDPAAYSALLRRLGGLPVITYRSVSQRTPEAFRHWLEEAWHQFQVRDLVLVGSPSTRDDIQLSLRQACAEVASAPQDFHLGGVTIAERHGLKGNEHQRLLDKMRQGCDFFVSQAVYDARASQQLVEDYARACEAAAEPPRRLILTFTPCGGGKTLEFMDWLGISVPTPTADQILSANDPLQTSIDICRRNLSLILDRALPLGIPLGLNIESLTNRREEIDASISLFRLLQEDLRRRLPAG